MRKRIIIVYKNKCLRFLAPVFILICMAFPILGEDTEDLTQVLLKQSVSTKRIHGVDLEGIPLVSGSTGDVVFPSPALQLLPSAGLLYRTRGWETIPNVIRNDGVDAFRVEIDTNGPVTSVIMDGIFPRLIPPEAPPIELRDDGLGGDRIAGDFIFTSGPFRYNTSVPMRDFYLHDPSSPAGIDVTTVAGTMNIEELDGTETQFLVKQQVGLLRFDIPETTITRLSPDIVVSPHLVNIRSTTRETQHFLRSLGGNLRNLTNSIYEVLPDVFDFFIFFSTNKVERFPRLTRQNFTAGVHSIVQVNYTGTGLSLFDVSGTFGSSGRLLGINVIDAYSRGINSNNVTHELIHQWASFTSAALGIRDRTPHYKSRSSVGSLVGGFQWIDNLDGTFTINCNEGRSRSRHASPLDKYMMGLIDAGEVPALYVYGEESLPAVIKCRQDEPVFVDEIVNTMMIEDIQSVHGIRMPGPANAQRNFRIAFLAESHDRFLNSTEMTFYEILAKHYTDEVPAQDPDPYMKFNWAPMTRFFGEGTTWRSDIPNLRNTK